MIVTTIKVVLLSLALLCFLSDTVGISGIAGKKTEVLLRPLGLVFWTLFMLVVVICKRSAGCG